MNDAIKVIRGAQEKLIQVIGSLALLYFFLGFHGGKRGSGPDRGQSPVEWAIQPSLSPSQPGLKPEAWLAGLALGLAGWASGLAGWASGQAGWPRGGDVHTIGRTYEQKLC